MYSIVDRKDYSKSPAANVCYSIVELICLFSFYLFHSIEIDKRVFTRRLANYKSSDDEDILMMMYQIYSYKYV